MRKIAIQQATFERLQRHAQPLVDTPESVIIRALDALDRLGVEHVPNGQLAAPEQQLDASALPDLTHTTILDASIAGKPIAELKWNLLRDKMLWHATKRAGSFENLQHLFPDKLVKGRKEDKGFQYLPEIDISVRRQNANNACHAMVTAAQALGISLNIGIMWQPKEAAAYPGERGRIII